MFRFRGGWDFSDFAKEGSLGFGGLDLGSGGVLGVELIGDLCWVVVDGAIE